MNKQDTKKDSSDDENDLNLNLESIRTLRKFLKKKRALIEDVRNYREESPNQELLLENYTDQEALDFRKEEKGKSDDEENVFVYICSNKRDKMLFPSPSFYKFELDSEVNNVVQASLVQANFPVIAENIKDLTFYYSFVPFTVLQSVRIPNGIYKGSELAIEISRQMNQKLHAGAILAGTYYVDAATGSVFDSGTKALPAGVEQFKVSFLREFRRIIFQLVDDAGVSNTPFAIHFSLLGTLSTSGGPGESMGFSYDAIKREASFEPLSQTYYLSTNSSNSFVTLADVDARFAYSIRGNQSPNQRGRLVIVLDIDPINGDGVVTGFGLGNAFGVIPIKPSFCNDGVLEINSTSYPVSKVYRNGLSRIKQLTIRLMNEDGSLFDFDGQEHFMTLRFTVKRTQPMKPMFCR